MNNKKRFRVGFILSILLVFLLSCSVNAAPAKVTNLKSTTSKKTIKLTWKKVSSAKGYEVYRVNSGSAPTLVKKTTKTSLSIKNCKYGTTYRFKVRAYDKSGATGAYSKVVSATPTVKKAPAPKYFRSLTQGDCSVNLRWGRCSGVKGFVIEMYDPAVKEFVVKKTITTGTAVKATIKNLTPNTTYKFRIRSYKVKNGNKILSEASSAISIKVVAMPPSVKEVRNAYYVTKTKKATTAKDVETKETINLKSGTRIVVTSKNGTTVRGFLKDGTEIKIKRSVLKYTGLDTSPKTDYSSSIKQQFVNLKGLSSPSRYLIWVSQSKCKVNVFVGSKGKWKLNQVFPCCVGKWDTRTAQGLHKVLKKIAHGEYNGPYIYFSSGEGTPAEPNGCAFHNQPDKRMSKAISHGCVRMVLSNLQWLYDNVPTGTTVYVY